MGLNPAEIFAFRWSTLLEEKVLILQKWGSRCIIYRGYCNKYEWKEITV
jgi:hypothetical protein